jgi:hypothetical protein
MNYKGRKARGDSTNGAVAAGNPTVIERSGPSSPGANRSGISKMTERAILPGGDEHGSARMFQDRQIFGSVGSDLVNGRASNCCLSRMPLIIDDHCREAQGLWQVFGSRIGYSAITTVRIGCE